MNQLPNPKKIVHHVRKPTHPQKTLHHPNQFLVVTNHAHTGMFCHHVSAHLPCTNSDEVQLLLEPWPPSYTNNNKIELVSEVVISEK